MVTVPQLDRLTRMDAGRDADPVRFMSIWQDMCENIEQSFDEINIALLAIEAAQAAIENKSTVFRQTSAPTAIATNDLWIDTDDGNRPYSWDGAAWVEVQDVGATYAIAAINPDGTIATDAVVTDSVLAEAIITKAYAFTAGSMNITSGSYTWYEVQSVTITTTGEDVEIEGGWAVNVIDNCKFQYRLLRDGTPFITIGPVTANTSDQPFAFVKYVDSPAADTYEYTLEVACNDAGDIDALNRGLSAKEIKR